MIEYINLTQSEINALLLSLKVAFWANLWSLPFAIAVAWILAKKDFWGKSLINGIVHLPLVLPPVVIGYLLLVGMGRNGVIGKPLYDIFGITFAFSTNGVILASIIVAFPLVVRSIRLAIESIDFRLEQAAETLGASPWRIFLTITLPLSLPGILAGMILGFARSLGEFGATITFVSNIPNVTQTLPLAMYSFTETPGGEFAAARLCLIAIVISLLALLASEGLARYTQKRLGQTNA